ncbi:hypothetical protein EAG_02877 [Camponotus floridanus]|uniref:Uncharacterized protein n=1 Tax=Camponotus floridanus TaxID=104421 RepID=E2AGF7_CAMFO|nr:uncharacterized protein LOC105252116 [Camponotus floridanus]EFN67490.1 hypothetical protein EAG_02877 [Camponotus floridanus]
MEKDLSNYFDKLRLKAREIDKGTNKLAETWKIPHLLVGGYAERTTETNACLNEIWKSLQDTKDKVEQIQAECKPMIEDMNNFIKESKRTYEELKEQCENLDIVLAEYGYQYEEDQYEEDSEREKHSRDDNKDITNDGRVNIVFDSEIEFTPDLTWLE